MDDDKLNECSLIGMLNYEGEGLGWNSLFTEKCLCCYISLFCVETSFIGLFSTCFYSYKGYGFRLIRQRAQSEKL